MNKPLDLWAVEWSDEQQCFHIALLEDALRETRIAFLLSRPLQFAIVAICRTHDQATENIRLLEEARTDQTNSLFNPAS